METQTNIPQDVADLIDENGYPTGVLDTLFGNLRYRVWHDGARITPDNTDHLITINRAEYRLDLELRYGRCAKDRNIEYGHPPYGEEAFFVGWFRSHTSSSYTLRRSGLYNNSGVTDAAREKVKEIVHFACKWLTANPDLLKRARENYLMRSIADVEKDASEQMAKARDRMNDIQEVSILLDRFRMGSRFGQVFRNQCTR